MKPQDKRKCQDWKEIPTLQNVIITACGRLKRFIHFQQIFYLQRKRVLYEVHKMIQNIVIDGICSWKVDHLPKEKEYDIDGDPKVLGRPISTLICSLSLSLSLSLCLVT